MSSYFITLQLITAVYHIETRGVQRWRCYASNPRILFLSSAMAPTWCIIRGCRVEERVWVTQQRTLTPQEVGAAVPIAPQVF
ncbi:unnamed protein product [Boreogadus saida]